MFFWNKTCFSRKATQWCIKVQNIHKKSYIDNYCKWQIFKLCAIFNVIYSEYISDFKIETLMDQNIMYLKGSSKSHVQKNCLFVSIQVMFAVRKLVMFHCIWVFWGVNLSFPEGLVIGLLELNFKRTIRFLFKKE